MTRQRLAIALLFLAVFIGVIVFRQGAPAVPAPPKAPRQVAPAPAIALIPDAPTGVVFSYVGPEKELPQQVPVYTTSSRSSVDELEADAKSFGAGLGFTSSPSALRSGQNYAASWMSSDEQLSFSKTQLKIITLALIGQQTI